MGTEDRKAIAETLVQLASGLRLAEPGASTGTFLVLFPSLLPTDGSIIQLSKCNFTI
jgi:hypothetical protein